MGIRSVGKTVHICWERKVNRPIPRVPLPALLTLLAATSEAAEVSPFVFHVCRTSPLPAFIVTKKWQTTALLYKTHYM